MKLPRLLLALVLCCFFTPAFDAAAADTGPAAWEPGKIVPDVYGYDQNGQFVQLRDFAGKNVIFEVSTSWCYPSFVLAVEAKAAKEYLEAQGVPFEFITVIAQDAMKSPICLRGQGQAWAREFQVTTPVISFFNGPNLEDPNKIGINAASNWLLRAAENSFPTLAIIGPDQVIKRLQSGTLSRDELVAEFLPGQPALPAVELPSPSFAVKRAKLKFAIGKQKSSSVDPFVENGSVLVVPRFQKGTLPEDYAGGILVQRAPQQEVWSILVNGHVNPFGEDPGFPTDQPITITVSGIKWDRKLEGAALASPTALVYLHDNIQTSYTPKLEVPAKIKGGDLVIGPFTLETVGPLYPFRLMTVDLAWVVANPELMAAFLGDSVTLQFSLEKEIQEDWIAQLRTIEEGAKAKKRAKTLAAIDKLTRRISRYKGEGLSKEGRKHLLTGLSKIRAKVRAR